MENSKKYSMASKLKEKLIYMLKNLTTTKKVKNRKYQFLRPLCETVKTIESVQMNTSKFVAWLTEVTNFSVITGPSNNRMSRELKVDYHKTGAEGNITALTYKS